MTKGEKHSRSCRASQMANGWKIDLRTAAITRPAMHAVSNDR